MKRWVIVLLALVVLLGAGAGYAILQLVTLQPPVVEINFIERKRAQRYQETINPAPITSYTKLEAGQAVLYRGGSGAKVIVALPDSGTGPWVFEKYLATLGKANTLYAVGLRGMSGAKPATQASFKDYLEDARDALEVARRDAGNRRVVLLGQGLGSLLALKLALEQPGSLESLVLVSPYPPRPWTPEQRWLARFVGERAYAGVFASPDAARTFWLENFPAWIVQRDIARLYLESHAKQKVPFEYPEVIREVTLGPLEWLEGAYNALERTSLPVLHLAGRYDVANPLGGQLELRKTLEGTLHEGYSFALLLSGRLIPLDWKWRESVEVIETFLKNGRLEKPFIQNEEVLDPVLDPPTR